MTRWYKRHEVTIGLLVDAFMFLAAGGLSVIFTITHQWWWARGMQAVCVVTLVDAYMINRTGRVLWAKRQPEGEGDD